MPSAVSVSVSGADSGVIFMFSNYVFSGRYEQFFLGSLSNVLFYFCFCFSFSVFCLVGN